MSDCCLPNLGCLAIPILSTNVNGPAGPQGPAGNGIEDATYDPLTGELTLTFTDAPPFTTPSIIGAQGEPGDNGVDGVARLYSNQTNNSVASPLNTPVTMDSYTLPANTLLTDGDAISITIYAKNNKTFNATTQSRFVIFGGINVCQLNFLGVTPYMYSPSFPPLSGTFYQYKLNVQIIRTSSSTIKSIVYADLDLSNSYFPPKADYEAVYFSPPTFDFTQPIPILTQLRQDMANGVTFTSVTIDKIKKL